MLTNILEQIGINEKEAKVYLACLRLGPSPVRRIAEETGVNRGTCYDLLRALMEKGLVSYYHQDKHKYFVAEDPSNLTELVSEQEKKLEKTRQDLKEIIPELKSIYDNAEDKPVVKYYEGLRGVKTILQDVLNSFTEEKQKEYFVYSAANIRRFLFRAYPDFTKRRIRAKIRVRAIAIGSGGRLCGLDQRRWLLLNSVKSISQGTPRSQKSSPTYILIYQNKTALISVGRDKNPHGVIIEDEGIYQTQVLLFEKLWESLDVVKRVNGSGCGRCAEGDNSSADV